MSNQTQQVTLHYLEIDRIKTSLALQYLLNYYVCAIEKRVRPLPTEHLFNVKQVNELHSLFTADERDERVAVSMSEELGVALYASLHVSNKFLNTDDGQTVLLKFVRLIIENPTEQHLNNTRKQLIDTNNFTIKNTREKLSHLVWFSAFDNALSALRL